MGPSEYIALGSVLVTLTIGVMTLTPALRRVLHEERAYKASRLESCQEDLELYRRKYLDAVLAGKRLLNQLGLLLDDHDAKCQKVECPYKAGMDSDLKEILAAFEPVFANGHGEKDD